MTNELLIQRVRQRDGQQVDLRIIDGVFTEIGPSLAAGDGATVIDGGNSLCFPGFVDAHAHMDKSLIGLPWHRHDVGPALLDKITHERELRREEGIDAHAQSSKLARLAIAAGTTHIRTFVDIDTEWKLAGFDGVLQTRDDVRDALSIQIVAFPQSGMLIRPGTLELMEDALKQGAEVVGGLDPSTIDRDPAKHLDVIFGLAEQYDADIDIHLHEPGDLGAFSVELIAERTKALGYQGRVVISHAICLGGVDDAYLSRLIDLLVETIHKIGVRSKRKGVTGIAKDIEKVYGKERLLVDIADAAIERHARAPHLPGDTELLCRPLSAHTTKATFGSGVPFQQRHAPAGSWGVGLDSAGFRDRLPCGATERRPDRRRHSAEMA